jgi:hypothetical protein
MVVGVGGGLFGSGESIPFLALPSLRAYLSANFAWLSATIATMHVVVFAYAVYVYAVYVYLTILGRAPMSSQFVTVADSASTTRLEVAC